VRPHDAADLAAIVVEHHEAVIVAEAGWLKRQHGASIAMKIGRPIRFCMGTDKGDAR